jgi:hypothetical protein
MYLDFGTRSKTYPTCIKEKGNNACKKGSNTRERNWQHYGKSQPWHFHIFKNITIHEDI